MKTKAEILNEVKALDKGELYQIKTGKTTYYAGRCFDGTWLLGAFLMPENLLYKNVSYDRKFKSVKAVIAKLNTWI